MSIDYDRLRELLDKAAPGPWEFHEDQEWEHVAGPEYPPMLTRVEHTVEGSDGEQLFGQFNSTVLEECPGNLRLAALAPDMARELLRLRNGIERVLAQMNDHATTLRRLERQNVAFHMEQYAHLLADELNGDTE